MPDIGTIGKKVVNQLVHVSNIGKTVFSGSDGRDKVAKATAAYFSVAADIMELTAASESTKQGFRTTAYAFKDARTVFGLFNIFTGKIPQLIGNIKTTVSLVAYFFDNDTPIPKSNAKFKTGQNDYTEKQAYKNKKEKVLGLIIESFSALEATAFIGAFGGCRPTEFFSKLFNDPSNQSRAKEGFFYIMVVRHITVPIYTIANVVHETLVFINLREWVQSKDWASPEEHSFESLKKMQRTRLVNPSPNENKLNEEGHRRIEEMLSEIQWHYTDVMIRAFLSLSEKGISITKDIIVLARFRVHPLVMVSLTFLGATFSLTSVLYKAYQATKFEPFFDED